MPLLSALRERTPLSDSRLKVPDGLPTGIDRDYSGPSGLALSLPPRW